MELAALLALVLVGSLAGFSAALLGLGGGFLLVPVLLFMGYDPGKAVGTSFLAITLISISALLSHSRLLHVDYKIGLALGIGGLVGAQMGALLLDYVPLDVFKKIFAAVLVLLAIRVAI